MRRLSRLSFACLLASAMAGPATAQDAMADVEITAHEIRPGVAVLFGQGGNIGVSYGEDGTVLIDDQFAPLTGKIQKAIARLGASPARLLINTHWHFDHAGGNENFGKAGAMIIAHDNVRKRLASGGKIMDMEIPPAAAEALPVLTYADGVKLHLNGETVDVRFLGGGHSDGDSVIMWRKSNVMHAGDLFVNAMGFPFIDHGSGGNVEHLLNSLGQIIAMTDEQTVIIPGHGKLATRSDLIAFRQMVSTAVERVRTLKESGVELAAARKALPLQGLRNGDGLVSDDDFVEAVWHSLEAHGH